LNGCSVILRNIQTSKVRLRIMVSIYLRILSIISEEKKASGKCWLKFDRTFYIEKSRLFFFLFLEVHKSLNKFES
jgi:hypothetical protein